MKSGTLRPGRRRLALGLALGAARLIASAQIEITSFDSAGSLEWSDDDPRASVYTVEWSSLRDGGAWRNNWDALTDIPATASTYRVEVPMAYRVMSRTNVLRSEWTVLFYWMADNNLEPDFIDKFLDLARWNSDTNVQLVVQFARNGLDERYGNWQGAERFVMAEGMTPVPEQAVADWGDGHGGRLVNMADPATLADFLDWAMIRHPARRTALFIGNHGYGWTGFGISSSYADSVMYIHELSRVLRETRLPVDVLALDACVMNMAEVVAEIGDSPTGYLLASETWGETDWPYGWLLEGLYAHPHWTPREFVTDVNERLWTYYSESNLVPTITLCTSDLSLAPVVSSHIADFVAGVLDTNVPITEVNQRATEAIGAINDLLIVRRMGPEWTGVAHGLSVFFPLKDGLRPPRAFAEYTGRRTRFALDAGWQSLLNAYYDPMDHPPFHSELITARAAITNYLDGGQDEHIDLIDFLNRFSNVEPR